jgi:hypothetical protein
MEWPEWLYKRKAWTDKFTIYPYAYHIVRPHDFVYAIERIGKHFNVFGFAPTQQSRRR